MQFAHTDSVLDLNRLLAGIFAGILQDENVSEGENKDKIAPGTS